MKPAPRAPGTTRKLFALSLSIALAMSGVGIIIPVVPSHIGRLGLAGASTEQVALHVSLLAAGYAFMQLLLAPLWGRLSDSLGRRPLLAIGLVGFAVGQALCGRCGEKLATRCWRARTTPSRHGHSCARRTSAWRGSMSSKTSLGAFTTRTRMTA